MKTVFKEHFDDQNMGTTPPEKSDSQSPVFLPKDLKSLGQLPSPKVLLPLVLKGKESPLSR